VPPPIQRRIAEQGLDRLGVERHPFQLEEDQRGLDLGDPLLDVLEQGPVALHTGVGGEEQLRVGRRAGGGLLEGLVLGHRPGEFLRAEHGHAPAIAALEGLGVGQCALEVHIDLGIVRALVEIGEVPADSRGRSRVARAHCFPLIALPRVWLGS
jgi:hypothetical protein